MNPFLPHILSSLLQYQEEFSPLGRSNLDQWQVPPEFVVRLYLPLNETISGLYSRRKRQKRILTSCRYQGRRFLEYFLWVLQQHDALCIGLYRNTNPSPLQARERDSSLPYSYANPPPFLVLAADDFAFVIKHERRDAGPPRA